MLNNKAGYFLITGFLTLLFFSACDDFRLCGQQNDTVTLRFIKEGKEEELSLRQLSIAGSDSAFVQDGTTGSAFSLPLSPLDTQATYIFEHYVPGSAQTQKDSVILSYTLKDSLQSVECGVLHIFEDIKVHSVSFKTDSVKPKTVQNNNVSTDERIVKIYLTADYNLN